MYLSTCSTPVSAGSSLHSQNLLQLSSSLKMPGPEHWYADPAAGWYVTVSVSAVVAASVVTSVSSVTSVSGAGAGVVTGGVAEVVVTAGAGAGLGAAPPHPGTTAGQLHTLGRVSSYWS